ncbi:MAG TPA: hypothetical protein VEK06_00845, partial [Myxococcota bacterium]|nr:hypothetical protein [Myxococcota bacterium]
VYKVSRFAFAMSQGSKREQKNLVSPGDTLVQDLERSHKNNLFCIEKVKSVVTNLGLKYRLICRSDLTVGDLHNQLVISVGGDGTLLDASHFCDNSLILGVNSDPEQSVGALCIANAQNVGLILTDILSGKLRPSALVRLAISAHGVIKNTLALNDVLYCHQNPAATSRYYMAKNDEPFQSQRSSGVWISTPAGSTGGIYSCGGQALPILAKKAIFNVREPYWTDGKKPLFFGSLEIGDQLHIRSNMSEAHLFIDGPHKGFNVPLGEQISIGIADKPLWLYDGALLDKGREKAIEQRKAYRRLLKDDD